jgi:hypothetical protein
MLTVAIALMRGSIFAALMTKLPLPQIPIAPILLLSTKGWVPKNRLFVQCHFAGAFLNLLVRSRGVLGRLLPVNLRTHAPEIRC